MFAFTDTVTRMRPLPPPLMSTLQHTDPDYSAAYVVLDTDSGLKGFGLTFTLGKGTEIGKIHAGRP